MDEYVHAAVLDRLRSEDVVAMLRPVDDPRVQELGTRAASLRARLELTERDYDADLIDGQRYAAKSRALQADLDRVSAARADLLAGSAASGVLGRPDPDAAFDSASLAVRGAVLDALLVVALLPAQRYVKGFDPKTVSLRWHRSRLAVGPSVAPVVLPEAVALLETASRL